MDSVGTRSCVSVVSVISLSADGSGLASSAMRVSCARILGADGSACGRSEVIGEKAFAFQGVSDIRISDI